MLEWLNAKPEVKQVVKDHFEGVPISKQNLSEWRQGGFQEWLARQELYGGVRNMADFLLDLEGDCEKVLADDLATVLAARFAGLLTHWNGEVDEKFEARSRVLNGICRSVVQLQRSMHRAKKDNEDYVQGLEEEGQRVKEMVKKRKLDQVWAVRREPVVAQLFGGGELGRKLAQYVVALENDVPGADLDLTGDEKPDPKLVPPPRKKRTVQPTIRRTVRRARKSRPRYVRKPLRKNKIKRHANRESNLEQSDPVKVSQTKLPQANDKGLGLGVGLRLGTEKDSNLPAAAISPTVAAPAAEEAIPETQEAREMRDLTECAEKGDPYSAYSLGARYRDGLGVPRDLAKAREWLGKAAAQGIGGAKIELNALVRRYGE